MSTIHLHQTSSNDRVPIGVNERNDETLFNTQLLFVAD